MYKQPTAGEIEGAVVNMGLKSLYKSEIEVVCIIAGGQGECKVGLMCWTKSMLLKKKKQNHLFSSTGHYFKEKASVCKGQLKVRAGIV